MTKEEHKKEVNAQSKNIEVTTREDLVQLMTIEFHKSDGSWDPNELKNYIKRLTKVQKEFLLKPNKKTKLNPKALIAYIVLGDGFIHRPIGGLWVTKDIPISKDDKWRILYPNASLALFYKDENDKVELVFYTRFLEIYYLYNKEIRRYFKDLAKNEQNIFKSLSDKYKEFSPVTEIPRKRYHFIIHTHKGGNCEGELFPWIRLWDPTKKKDKKHPKKFFREPNFFGKGNTIHGTLNTRACWMLLRNYILDENKYRKFMECYLLSHFKFYFKLKATRSSETSLTGQTSGGDASISADECKNFRIKIVKDERAPTAVGQIREITSHTAGPSPVYRVSAWTVTPSKNATYTIFCPNLNLRFGINYAYFAFINKLTGINFNSRDNNIKVPRMLQTGNNCWKESPIPKWGQNVFGQQFGYDKPWAEVFIFKRGDHFTPDPGDTNTFK